MRWPSATYSAAARNNHNFNLILQEQTRYKVESSEKLETYEANESTGEMTPSRSD